MNVYLRLQLDRRVCAIALHQAFFFKVSLSLTYQLRIIELSDNLRKPISFSNAYRLSNKISSLIHSTSDQEMISENVRSYAYS